jgi:hypothetical protein
VQSKINTKNRKELEIKIKKVFSDDIKNFSPDMQKMFIDDFVTVYQNRVSVLSRFQAKNGYNPETTTSQTQVIFESTKNFGQN